MTTATVLVYFQVGGVQTHRRNSAPTLTTATPHACMSRHHLPSESVPCCTNGRREMEQHNLQRERQLRRSPTTFSRSM